MNFDPFGNLAVSVPSFVQALGSLRMQQLFCTQVIALYLNSLPQHIRASPRTIRHHSLAAYRNATKRPHLLADKLESAEIVLTVVSYLPRLSLQDIRAYASRLFLYIPETEFQ